MNTLNLGWLKAGLASTALIVAGCKTASEDSGIQVPAADSVYLNASVYTVDDDQPWAEAVAVKDGELVYVGSNKGVAAYAGGDTHVTDLGGKMMLPGFVDSHMHPLMGGAYALALSLDTFAGPEDWVRAVDDYAEQHKDKPVIFGYGFLASAFGADGPHKSMLDKVVSDRPVLLMDEGFHGAWANSKALEVLNITKDTADIDPGFSYYKRGDNNEPTGYLLEGTAGKAMEDLDVITLESIAKGSEVVFNIMNSYGITAVFDAGAFDAGEHQVSVLKKLQDSNKMHVRYVGSHAIVSADQIDGAIDRVEELRRTSKNDRFHVNMLKIMNDGTIEGKTAAMFEDYQGDPGNNGKTVFSQEQMNELVSESAKRNIDVHIHALGERAIHEALNAIELAKQTHKDSISRFAICHVQVVTDESIKRFAELGVVAQSTPLWTSFDSQGQKYVSEDQFNRYFRYNSFKENNVTMAFGSDFPASGAGTLGMSPVFNMEIGHTRQETGERDAPIQPNISERLDIASLIRGYTLGSAYQLRMEDQIGSLEVGKKADFVVLDKNLFETDPYTFSDVKVTMTVMDGNVVYSSR